MYLLNNFIIMKWWCAVSLYSSIFEVSSNSDHAFGKPNKAKPSLFFVESVSDES